MPPDGLEPTRLTSSRLKLDVATNYTKGAMLLVGYDPTWADL